MTKMIAALVMSAASAGVHAQSEDLKHKTAAVINLRGHLCAEVTRITPVQTSGLYEVECIAYRGGQTKVTYILEAATAKVTKL